MNKDEETNTIEFEQMKPTEKRSAALTNEDLNQLMLQGIDITGGKAIAKASEIKILWAKKYSINKMEKHFLKQGKERGYKSTTLSKYVNAYNKTEALQNVPIKT